MSLLRRILRFRLRIHFRHQFSRSKSSRPIPIRPATQVFAGPSSAETDLLAILPGNANPSAVNPFTPLSPGPSAGCVARPGPPSEAPDISRILAGCNRRGLDHRRHCHRLNRSSPRARRLVPAIHCELRTTNYERSIHTGQRIPLWELPLVPVGVDRRHRAGRVEPRHLLRRQIPSHCAKVRLQLFLVARAYNHG